HVTGVQTCALPIFDIRLRFPYEYRKSEADIKNILVPSLSGKKVPLKEIATIHAITGPAFVYRDNNSRFIGVKFSVRERDLGSTIADAQARVTQAVSIQIGRASCRERV